MPPKHLKNFCLLMSHPLFPLLTISWYFSTILLRLSTFYQHCIWSKALPENQKEGMSAPDLFDSWPSLKVSTFSYTKPWPNWPKEEPPGQLCCPSCATELPNPNTNQNTHFALLLGTISIKKPRCDCEVALLIGHLKLHTLCPQRPVLLSGILSQHPLPTEQLEQAISIY